MGLDRIYASKMYLTSTRKDRIHAAIQDPLNIELVQQVSSYLDSDSKAKLQEAVAEKEAAEAQVAQESADAEANVFDQADAAASGGSSGGSTFHGGSSGSSSVFDDFDAAGEGGADDLGSDMSDGDFDAPDIDVDGVPTPEADVDVDIEESTEVIADDGIEITSSEEEEAPAIQSGIIKKLLNEQDDTKGVVRVDPTDDEVWIYYEDKVNLNDVMDNVITLIKNTYAALKFSRLARTDNAVVFDIKE